MKKSENDKLAPPYALVVGVIATFLVGMLVSLAERFGLDRGWSTLCVITVITCALFKLYPEPRSRPWSAGLVTILVMCGVVSALAWYGLLGWRQLSPGKGDAHWAYFSMLVVTVVVVIPIYEEKVVRHLLFAGLSRHINTVLAAVAVSLAFGWVHKGNMLWVFCVSILMCWLAVRHQVSTLQRAVLHGSYNLTLVVNYLL